MLSGLALSVAQQALAQQAPVTLPDPGAVLRNLQDAEKRDAARSRAAPPPTTAPAQPPQQLSPERLDTKVLVRSFSVEGVKLFTPDEIRELLKPMVGRSLTLPELIRQVQVVTAAYTRKGYIASTFVPEQEVVDGVILLVVNEGRLGAVRVQVAEGTAFSAETASAFLTARQKEGEPIRIPDLERSMLLLNDLSGISARSTLQPGAQGGLTDEVVDLQRTPKVTATLDADNSGTRSVGENRLGAFVKVHNVDGRGGRASIDAIGMFVDNRVNSYASAGYQTPLGVDGLNLQLGASRLDYRLGEQFSTLLVKGSSNTLSAGVNYPVIRSSTENLRLNARYEHRSLQATTGESCVPLTNKRVDALQLGVAYDRIGSLADSQLTANAQLTQGNVRFRESQIFSAGLCGQTVLAQIDPSGTKGAYTKLAGAFSYQRQIDSRWSWSVGASGQYALKNLDTSEQFSLGGPFGVRAYPASEAAGDQGALANLELRYLVSPGLTASTFVDTGYVKRRHDTSAQPLANNEIHLSGAGLGVYYAQPGRFNLGASVSWRIGSNPLRNTDGTDSDSRKRNPRLWVNGSYFF